MGTYAVTHIKHNNQILPFSDSYDGYISDGMGEYNLLCIRNMSTNFLRNLFDTFTAYKKIDVDKTSELSSDELYDEEHDDGPNISKLKIHNFIQRLKGDENNVTKDKDFEQWLKRLDGFTSTSINGAPIVLGLNESVHYGRDYQECDYLIDLDNETFFTMWTPFSIPFSAIRKMSSSQITMLCDNPYKNMADEKILQYAKEKNVSKDIFTCSLQKLIDLANEQFEYSNFQASRITVQEKAQKLQPTLDEFIQFILNNVDENSNSVEEPIDNSLETSIPPTLVPEDRLGSMLKEDNVTQVQVDSPHSLLNESNTLNPNNFSYSISTFKFHTKRIFLDIMKIIALKNFLQQNFNERYPNLDKELKLFIEDGIIELISFDKRLDHYSFSDIYQQLFDKYPSSIQSSSLFANHHLNPESEEAKFYAFYQESMFIKTEDFLQGNFPDKEQLMLSKDKINALFAITYLKDIATGDNLKYLELNDQHSTYAVIFALHSFNKELYDLTIGSLLDVFNPQHKEFKAIKDGFLDSILSFHHMGDFVTKLPFCTKEALQQIKDFNQFIYNHPSTSKFMEFLTDNEKTIFTNLVK